MADLKVFAELGGDVVLYQCPTCGKLYSSGIYLAKRPVAVKAAKHAAEICCKQHHCEDCGGRTQGFQTVCFDCRKLRNLRTAEVVEWDGECTVFDGDDSYWSSLEEAQERGCVYVHPTVFQRLVLNPESVFDQLCEEHHEQMHEELVEDKNWGTLEKAIEEFNFNTKLGSWEPEMGQVIVLDQERFENLITPKGTPDGHPD